MNRNDGGPAYPVPRGMNHAHEGMSLVDAVAIKVLPLVAGNFRKGMSDFIESIHYDAMCDDAIDLAEAFVRAKNRAAHARAQAAALLAAQQTEGGPTS